MAGRGRQRLPKSDPHWGALPRALRFARLACLLLLTGALSPGLSISAVAAEPQAAESQSPPVPSDPAPTPAAPIPVERIAPSAADVAKLLRGFAAAPVPDGEILAIRAALPTLSAHADMDLGWTQGMLKEQPPLEALQTDEQLWQGRQRDLMAWLSTLTDHVTALQDAVTQLQGLQATWTLTRQAATRAGDPAGVLQLIDGTLAQIEAAEPRYRVRRDEALDLQGRIAREVARCETARTWILDVQRSAVGGIFARDSRPLWSPEPWAKGLAVLPDRLPQILASYGAEIRVYLRDPAKRMPLHLGLFVLALVALFAARTRVRRWAANGEDVSRMAVVLERPVAAAALVALMLATSFPSPTPLRVKELLGALALAPLIVLVRPLAGPAVRPALYALGLLFALDTVPRAFGGVPPVVGQAIVFVESLAGGIALISLLRSFRSEAGQARAFPSGPHGAWRLLAAAALAILAIGLVASLLGYLRLARLATPAVLVGGADALWLYAAVEVGTALVAFAFRVWPLRRLHMVANHRDWLLPRIQRWLLWLAVLSWCFRYLDYLGLWGPTLTMVQGALAARLTLGSFSTSAGDVLAFAVTLWVAYLLSAALRFVLDEEVYPRVGMAAGASYAASSLLQYSIAILALFLALGFLGVTLTQVTVFAGALGVGIGLGLQGVVHNFVAGLILLFEQPIHVGDAVQMGDLQGRVRRIGIRASVVRTLEGAEVIIPNSQLTSNQVTNWTLSDQQRRLDLPVGLAYGTEPAKAIALLEGVARRHPGILPDPPPRCLFMSYGDSSIDFELRAWTDYDIAQNVRSGLTAAVYDAIYAAGMSFPFPQREVRLLSEGGAPEPTVQPSPPAGSQPSEPADRQKATQAPPAAGPGPLDRCWENARVG
jgi:potassium efflux system protein